MKSFRECLHLLERAGELVRVREEVSIEYDITYISRELEPRTIVFEKVKESLCGTPVTNVYADRARLARFLGCSSIEELYEKLLKAEEHPTKLSETSPEHRVFEGNLEDLAVPKFYERDRGRYLTASIAIARSPSGVLNASVHRILLLGRNKATIRIVPRHLNRIVSEWVAQGSEEVPIAIVVGVDPATALAAASSPPYGVFELEVANALAGGTLKVFYVHGEIPVPATAEVVIEAVLKPKQLVDEGPFTDILGVYDIVRKQPLIEVRRIYVREGSEFYMHSIVPAGSEHMVLMGFEKEAKIWKFVKNVVPEVKAVRLTRGGSGWLHAVISIKKQSDGDAKNAILAAFAAHPSLKHVVVVDEDIDVDDPVQVEWAIATRFRGDRDLVIIKHARGSTLDPVAEDPVQGITTKVGIDATMPLSADKKLFERARAPASEKAREIVRRLLERVRK